jgi:hypothetical protein
LIKRCIPRHVAIDVPLVGQRENVNSRVAVLAGLGMLRPGPALALILIDPFADVFDDLGPGGDRPGGVNTATMDPRALHLAQLALPAGP